MKKLFIYVFFGVILLIFGLMSKNLLGLSSVLGLRNEHIDFPDAYTISTWLWTSPDEIPQQEVKELLSFAYEEKINTIYLNIEKYLEIIEKEDKGEKQTEITNFENSLIFFIQEANQKKISIQALAGSPLWINSSHDYIPFLLLNFVFDFNKRHPQNKLTGFQYDIEFYNQKDYQTHTSEYSNNYLGLVGRLVDLVKKNNLDSNNNFALGFAIPFWFDSQSGGKIFNDLASKMNQNEGNYLAIMAYRNYQVGNDGSIELIKDEVSYVENQDLNLSLLIAQETGPGESPKTTFQGKTRQDLKRAFISIAEYFKDYHAFSGIAIHDIYSYKKLRDK